MSENAKSITFVAVGLAAILLGVATAPSTAEVDDEELVGKELTKNFKEPDAAKRLRIVRFDEDTATLRDFEVAEQNGLWSIPSKDGYPADAARQMAEAATSLMDRKILSIASKNAGEHEQFGVIDPLSPKLEVGQKGVGTRVTMSDGQSKPLVDLIVGKAVRDADTQRYVREAGRDVVYVIEIDPSKLSTSFEDWIEKDLLKLDAWDLQQVELKDYSAEMGLVPTGDGRVSIGIAWDPRAEMTLAYNDTDSKWNPVKLRKFDSKKDKDGEYVDFTLAEDEELNAESLNALKSALDELQIVDVKRKPAGLSENLKAGEDFMNNREAFQDLMSKGFAATASPDGKSQEIISSDGEVIATMKNGAEYVLRFGNLTNVAGSQDGQEKDEKTEEKSADPAAKDSTEKKVDKSDVHRYLFVMARLNESALKPPELAKLPDLPANADGKAEQPPADGAPKADEEAAAAEAPAAADAEAKKDEGDKPAEPAAEDKAKAEEKAEAPAADAKDAAKPAADAKAEEAGEKKDDAAKGEDAAAKSDEVEAKGDDAAAKGGEQDKELEKIIAERKRIEQENQRKLDEYQALRKKGQDVVKDLNLRFGDWYFVVSDDVFQKVRLSSDKVIKKKEKPKTEGEAAAEGKDAAAPPTGIPGLPQIPGATK